MRTLFFSAQLQLDKMSDVMLCIEPWRKGGRGEWEGLGGGKEEGRGRRVDGEEGMKDT
jgi:hypothetical protein